MRKTILLLLLMLVSVLIAKPVFSQDDLQRTLIGTPTSNEKAANIVADGSGNTYVGGVQDKKGLIVKQNALHQTLWAKTLAFTSNPVDETIITFMDLVGDTVFGCGTILRQNELYAFYFKLDAQTGMAYWSKFNLASQAFFSCMRYANGKFFLIGGVIDPLNHILGKVVAVSSQSGTLVWETPLKRGILPWALVSAGVGNVFVNATEVSNGKFYITGYCSPIADITNSTSSNAGVSTMPLLIGINENGVVFLEKWLDIQHTSGTLVRYYGYKILQDADKNLLMSSCRWDGNVQDDFIITKCDTLGNVLFSNNYEIGTGSSPNFTIPDAVNETSGAYVFFGTRQSSGGSFPGSSSYVLKMDKNGNVQQSVIIVKPNTFVYGMGLGLVGGALFNPSLINRIIMTGNSSFLNGKHYFVSPETSSGSEYDINQIILNENLDEVEDCSRIFTLSTGVNNVPATIQSLPVTNFPHTMSFQNGIILTDLPPFVYCTNTSLNLVQNSGCEESVVTANTTGFTAPTFYWSDGTVSTSNTLAVSSTDTLFLRVLDTKCCELFDTIVPVITSSPMTMTLPADTVVCLQSGGAYPLLPTVSNPNATPVQYLWSNNTTFPWLSVTTSGTYWVEVSDSCKTIRDSIVVTVQSLPTITNAGPVTVCEGSFPVNLNPVVSAGTTVMWEDGSTLIPRSVSGVRSYTLSATNSCGTRDTVITVNQSDLPEIVLTSSADTCVQNGQSILLSPIFTGTTGVLWSNGSTGNQLSVSTSGTYIVVASNSCGVDSATCSVTINHFPELNLPATLDTCFEVGVGFSYTAFGSGGSYQWSSGSQTATTWISQEGMVSCTLTNVCGSITDSMQVRRYTAVDLYFAEDSIRECQKQLSVSLLHVETNYNLEIFAPGGNLIGTYLAESGWYTIHAFNPCGEVWDSIYVNLQNEQFFYLPNSFTPNGDSYNERFEFEGENVEVRSIRIFNRWGEEIFSQAGSFTGWDGTYKGEACPTGMYAVSVIYEDCFGMPTEFNGHVNLIK